MEHSYEELQAMHVLDYNNSRGDLKGYDCELCKNRGYFVNIDNGYEKYRECRCLATRRALKKIEKSGLKDLLDDYTFAKYRTKEKWQVQLKEKAVWFAEDDTKAWFYLGGQVGAGKTHLCTAIVSELLKKGIGAMYMPWRDDSTTLKASVTDDREYSKLINPLKTAPVLYIDDFFKTEKGKSPSPADINLAFEIINYRYNNKNLVTIISSEKSVDEILEIDEAVGSRIYQRSKGYCFNVGKSEDKNYRMSV